jgi:hypothetical protein
MTRLKYERTNRETNSRRYGTEDIHGGSPVPAMPRQARPRRGSGSPKGSGPDISSAIATARYRATDVGVRFALAAAEAGFTVTYANDWSPGRDNEDALRAGGVEVVVCLPKRTP